MNIDDAIYFAELMEDFLDIPSFVCEIIEHNLTDGKYKDVIEFIIERKKEIEKENIKVEGDKENEN